MSFRLSLLSFLRDNTGLQQKPPAILDAKDDDGNVVMSRTLVDPNYADAGSFLESAMMACSPKDLYTALGRLCMEESLIIIGLMQLFRKIFH